MGLQTCECAVLIGSHQTRISRYIRGQDRSETAFDGLFHSSPSRTEYSTTVIAGTQEKHRTARRGALSVFAADQNARVCPPLNFRFFWQTPALAMVETRRATAEPTGDGRCRRPEFPAWLSRRRLTTDCPVPVLPGTTEASVGGNLPRELKVGSGTVQRSRRRWSSRDKRIAAVGHGQRHQADLRARARRRPRPRRELLQHNQVGAGAPRPRNQLAAIAAHQASEIRSLPWQRARRSGKSPPHARGLARTISASPLPDTSGPGESRSVTGSSTPRARQERSSTPRSDSTKKRRPAPKGAGDSRDCRAALRRSGLDPSCVNNGRRAA